MEAVPVPLAGLPPPSNTPLMRPQVQEHLYDVFGEALEVTHPTVSAREAVDRLLQSLAPPPALTTIRVNFLKYQRETVVTLLQEVLGKQYTAKALPPPTVKPHPTLDDVIVIPNAGPRTDIQPQRKKVIVGEQCGSAVLRGADVFVPGLMGAPKDLRRGDYVSVYADLDRQCKRGLSVPYEGKTLFVGNGNAQFSRRELFSASAQNSGVAVRMTEALYTAPVLNSELVDAIFLQNLPSTITSLVMDPQPGEIVLDMCAAPGGKTTHIACLMKDQGCVIALDKSRPKVLKLRENVQRFGLTSVHCFTSDATKALGYSSELCSGIDSTGPTPPPYPPESFDRVLLDAPCSAMGQRPQAVCHLSLKALLSYPRYQQQLLTQAIGLLKPGGTLVYSTCTISPEENERQVQWVLRKYPQMKLVDQVPFLGTGGIGCEKDIEKKVQRFWPSPFLSYLRSHSDVTMETPQTLPQHGDPSLPLLAAEGHEEKRIAVGHGLPTGREPESLMATGAVGPVRETLQDTIGFFIAKFVKSV